MSIDSSVRLLDKTVTALHKINESDKIHKKELKQLYNFINKIHKAGASNTSLYHMSFKLKAGTLVDNPQALKNTFSMLRSKLDQQKSAMHSYKENMLNSIEQKLKPIVDDLHLAEKEAHLAVVRKEMEQTAESISSEENNICQYNEKITTAGEQVTELKKTIKELVVELEETSDNEFVARDAKLAEDVASAVSELKAQNDAKIAAIEDQISEQKNCRAALLDFARAHQIASSNRNKSMIGMLWDKVTEEKSYTVEEGIHHAENDSFYINDNDHTRTWRDHMCSDKYAMSKFGYDLVPGRREYSVPEKVPNARAMEWQTMMKDFNQSLEKIRELESTKQDLVTEYTDRAETIEAKKAVSSIGKILNTLESRYNDLDVLEQQIKSESEHFESAKNTVDKLAIQKEGMLKRQAQLNAELASLRYMKLRPTIDNR